MEGLTFKAAVRGIAALIIIGLFAYMLIAQLQVPQGLDLVVKGLLVVLTGVLGISAVQEWMKGNGG